MITHHIHSAAQASVHNPGDFTGKVGEALVTVARSFCQSRNVKEKGETAQGIHLI